MYKKYRTTYLAFASAACFLIGFLILFYSIAALHKTADANERQRVEIAANWIEDQMKTLEEIAYQINITVYYKPAYFERKGLYAQDMVEDLAKYHGYSPVISDIRLLYKEDPDFVYGAMHKSSLYTFADWTLGEADHRELLAKLMNVQGQTVFTLSNQTEFFFVAQLLRLNGLLDPGGDAVVFFVVPVRQLLSCLQRVSGVDTEHISELNWNGEKIIFHPLQGEALTVTSGNGELTVYHTNTLFSTETLSLAMAGLIIIAVVLSILAVIAIFAAQRDYKPIASLVRKFDLIPENEFSQIEHILTELRESNHNSQNEINNLLEQMQLQRQRMRGHLMARMLSGSSAIHSEQLNSVGLNMDHTLFCVAVLLFDSPLSHEDQVLKDIESLTDENIQMYAARISGQEHFAVIINADDAYDILNQKELILDVISSMHLTATISMGEIVRGINQLSYSLQCALFGLYEGTSADMSMFGDNAVQKMLDLAENGNAEESKHMLENVCQLVEKSYPLRVMQQSIFCQIADKLNLLVIQFGGEDRTIELHRLIMVGSPEQYISGMKKSIIFVASAANNQNQEKSAHDTKLKKELLDYIQNNLLDSQFSQEMVAEKFGISERQVGRLVKDATGISYKDYVINIKIEKAKEYLSQGLTVTDTCIRIGYTNIPHFIKMFKERTGVTPGNWKP